MYGQTATLTGAPTPKMASDQRSLTELSITVWTGTEHVAARLSELIQNLERVNQPPKDTNGPSPTMPIASNLAIAVNNLKQIDEMITVLRAKLFN